MGISHLIMTLSSKNTQIIFRVHTHGIVLYFNVFKLKRTEVMSNLGNFLEIGTLSTFRPLGYLNDSHGDSLVF